MFAQSIAFDIYSAATAGFQLLGLEFSIFTVTLLAAFVFRHLGQKSFEVAKLKTTAFEEKAPVVTWKRSANLVASIQPWDSGREACLRSSKSGKNKQAFADMLDDIALQARDPQSTRVVNLVMQMYDNLLARLAEKDMDLPEVATMAKHTLVEVYSSLVYCVVRASRFNLVERLLDDMISKGVARPLHFYESTMKQLAGVKKYKFALSVYDRLAADGLEPSPVTLSCLINFAAEVGELRRAVSFFEILSSVSTPSIRAYMTVLRVHSLRQDWPSAMSTINDMKCRGVAVDTLALNVALSTGVMADHLEAVEALVNEASSVDIVSYNTLIKGYALRSNLAKAEQAFQSLLRRGLRPNAITFNTIMDAAVRSGDCAYAWHVLDDMELSYGLKPDRFTCSILVKGVAKCREDHIHKALALVRKVAESCDKAFLSQVLHTLFEACQGCAAPAPLAQQVLAEMRQRKVVPSSSTQRQLLQVIANMANREAPSKQ